MAFGANELASAYISLIPTTRNLAANTSKALAGAVPASEKTGRSMGSAIGSGIKTTMKGVGLAVAGIIGVAVVKGFQRQTQIENAQKKLAGLGHSAKSVTTIMDNALASVKGTAFGLDEAATVSASVVAAGIKPGKDLEKTLRLVADAATIGGSSLSEMGLIFGKVATSNKVQGDVINQLNAQGIPIVQLLGKAMGKTSEEVVALSRKGKVSFADFEKAMSSMSGAALSSGDTTTGAWKNMGAALSRFGVALLSGVFPSLKKGFGGMTDLIDRATVAIGPFATILGKLLGSALEGLVKWLGGLDFTKAGKGLEEVARGALAFKNAWVYADGEITSSGFPGFMEKAGYIAKVFFTEARGGIRAFAAAWKYNDGEITSSGFPGFMERAGYWARQLWDALRKLDFTSFKGFLASLSAAGGPAGTALSSIGDSLVDLLPAAKEFVRNLPKMGGAVAKLAGAGLEVLVDVLGFLADHVDTIIDWMPAIVAGFVAWRVASLGLEVSQRKLMAAQIAAAPIFLANSIIRLAAARTEERMALATTRATIAENVSTGARKKSIVVLAAQKLWTVATTVATKAATLAQKALNLVLRANPIGLVITAIALLVAGLVWFFTKTKAGQAIVKAAWKIIGDSIANVIAFWTNKVVPGFKIGWLAVKAIFRALGDWIGQVWREKISPPFNWLRDFILVKIPNAFMSGRNKVRDFFGGIGKSIGDVWREKISPPLNRLKDFIFKTLPNAFRDGVGFVKKHWAKLFAIARIPINLIINAVYMGGLKKAFDAVAAAVGLTTRLPKIAPIPAHAKGGIARKGWALVGEEGPELVNFTDPGRVYTAAQSKAMLAGGPQMDAAALKRAEGDSPSDSLLPVGGWWEDAKRNIKTALSIGNATRHMVADEASGWVRGNLANMASGLLSPLVGKLSGLPDTMLGNTARGAAGKALDALVSWISGKDEGGFTGGGGGGSFGGDYTGARGGWRRPASGPFTSLFGRRWGGFHSGVDIAGHGWTYAALNGVVKKVGWNLTKYLTGIGIMLGHGGGLETYYGHNPSLASVVVKPGQRVRAGQHIGAQGSTGNATGDHLHFGVYMNGRAVNPMPFIGGLGAVKRSSVGMAGKRPLLFDQGGMLPPGISLVDNQTRKPEPLANLDQLQGRFGGREQVRLVVDGYEFTAYVETVSDRRQARNVGQLRQVRRQFQGSN